MTWQAITAGSSAPAELLLTWLVQSTVLLALGLLIGKASRRWGPAVQSAVYRTTLAAVLLCPVVSMGMAAMGLGGLVLRLPDLAGASELPALHPVRPAVAAPPAAETGADQAEQTSVEPSTTRSDAASPLALESRRESTALAVLAPSASSDEISSRPDPTVASTQAATPAMRLISVVGISLLGLWAIGSALLGVRLAVGQSRMAQLRLGAFPADPDADTLCRSLAGQMRLAPPSVLRSPFLSSPCLDGLRRPAILLPEDAEANLRETFIHELAHLSRRDGLWNLLRRMASALLWVQPLLWMLSRRIEETAEEVCDDFVVAFGADRTRYAGHLLDLAGRTLPPLAPAGVGMISLPSLLGRRIRRILDSSRQLSTERGTSRHRRDAGRRACRNNPRGTRGRRHHDSRGPRR